MTSNLPLKTKVSLTLDSNVAEQVRHLSDDSFRSFSQYVNLVLKRHIRDMEKNDREPL